MFRQNSPAAGSSVSMPDAETNFRTRIKDLPSHLHTASECWSSLLLVAISGAFASGPVASWPTLEPLLISQGVWEGDYQQEKLTAVFSISMGVTLVSVFLTGALYDALGPRALGAGGAYGSAISLMLMALAIQVPALNDLLWIAYPLTGVCGAANSFDVYAFLWLLPDDLISISAIVGAIQCLSDSFILVGVYMHDHYNFQVEAYLTLSAILAFFAGVIALLIVPSRQIMHQISHAATRDQAAAEESVQGYGAIDNTRLDSEPQQSVDDDCDSFYDALSKSWESTKHTLVLVSKVHPGISFLFTICLLAQYMFCLYPTLQMYPLYLELLGPVDATILVNIFGAIYAFVGAAALLAFGWIVDKVVGIWWSYAGLSVVMVVNAYFYSVPSVSAQVVAQVLLTFTANVWYVYVPRFATAYAPPELFGTVTGLQAGLLGLGQIVLTKLGTWICGILLQVLSIQGTAITYLVTIDLWCVCSLASTFLLLWWWWHEPIPRSGSTTMADVQKAIDNYNTVEGEVHGRSFLSKQVNAATSASKCLP